MKLAAQIVIAVKTAISAISGLLSLYLGIQFLLAAVSPTNQTPAMFFCIVSFALFVYFVVSSVLGIVAISRLNKAKCKADIPIALGIFILILNSNVGGILMLCLKDEHFMPKELVEFKKLLGDGIITQEEYDAKAAQLSK